MHGRAGGGVHRRPLASGGRGAAARSGPPPVGGAGRHRRRPECRPLPVRRRPERRRTGPGGGRTVLRRWRPVRGVRKFRGKKTRIGAVETGLRPVFTGIGEEITGLRPVSRVSSRAARGPGAGHPPHGVRTGGRRLALPGLRAAFAPAGVGVRGGGGEATRPVRRPPRRRPGARSVRLPPPGRRA